MLGYFLHKLRTLHLLTLNCIKHLLDHSYKPFSFPCSTRVVDYFYLSPNTFIIGKLADAAGYSAVKLADIDNKQ